MSASTSTSVRTARRAYPDGHAATDPQAETVEPLSPGLGRAQDVTDAPWPALPTETDIYLLPDGRVVIADLPSDLVDLAAALGAPEPCEVTLSRASVSQSEQGEGHVSQ